MGILKAPSVNPWTYILMMMMMKRSLFTTQIFEHTAYSLLIRVDNGFFLFFFIWTRFWVLVKWSSLLIKHYFRKSFLQFILNVGREWFSHSNGILPFKIEIRFAKMLIPTFFSFDFSTIIGIIIYTRQRAVNMFKNMFEKVF